MVTIIGIAGGSGSGKTTIAQKLCSKLNDCVAISHDDFYKPLGHLSELERDRVNFDSPQALETELLVLQLKQLRKKESIEVPIYCFDTHMRLPQTKVVKPHRYILVDGVLLFSNNELVELFDLKIFVDASDSVRFERRLQRDVEERGRDVDSVRRQWRESVRPMFEKYVEPTRAVADVVISTDGRGEKSPSIEDLVKRIRDLKN